MKPCPIIWLNGRRVFNGFPYSTISDWVACRFDTNRDPSNSPRKTTQDHVQYYQVPEENLEEIGTLSAPATNITFAASVSGYCTPGHGLCTTVNKPVSCPIAGRRSSIRRDPIGSLYEHAV
ncbi:MAG: hypothetical protein VX206_09740 [Pseudomonadota bacterium]|nr:hypothetical protein [Pseudomonadales bacterium]MEE3291006.1 hypothetical protein [Pseudomonadota bacterium]